MGTSSARPDHLDAAADGLIRAGSRLLEAVERTERAAIAYQQACPDLPLQPVSISRAGSYAADVRSVANTLRLVAEAFRLADARHEVVHTTDLTVAERLLTDLHGADAALTAPARAREARGRFLGRLLGAAVNLDDPELATRFLDRVSASEAADPVLSAALLERLSAPQLVSLVEYLSRTGDPAHPDAHLRTLAALLASAAQTVDRPGSYAHLDRRTLDALLVDPAGRSCLRVLLASHRGPQARSFLRLVAPALLLEHSVDDDAVEGPTTAFLTAGGRDGDEAVLAAVIRTLGAAHDLLTGGPPAELDRRTARLVTLVPGGGVALPLLLGEVLWPPGTAPALTAGARLGVLRGLVTGIAGLAPTQTSEQLAQVLAEAIATDPTYFLGRADGVGRAELGRALDAVTRFERPWLTALDGLRVETARRVDESLHAPLDVRATVLADLGVFHDEVEASARRSDLPRDTRRAEFALLATALRTAGGTASARFGPVARLVVTTGIGRAVEAWHQATVPDPGDHGSQTAQDREALRHLIWVAVARDRAMAPRLVWPDARTGLQITGPERLGELTGTTADVDELAAWARRQPADLRALVDTYVDSTR